MKQLNENRKNGSRSEASVEIDYYEVGVNSIPVDEFTEALLDFITNI